MHRIKSAKEMGCLRKPTKPELPPVDPGLLEALSRAYHLHEKVPGRRFGQHSPIKELPEWAVLLHSAWKAVESDCMMETRFPRATLESLHMKRPLFNIQQELYRWAEANGISITIETRSRKGDDGYIYVRPAAGAMSDN